MMLDRLQDGGQRLQGTQADEGRCAHASEKHLSFRCWTIENACEKHLTT